MYENINPPNEAKVFAIPNIVPKKKNTNYNLI